MIIETFLGFLLCICALLFLATGYWYVTWPKKIPPGPRGIPFIGTPINRLKPHQHLTTLSKTYGPIYSFYNFDHLVIVLNSYELVRDLIVKQGEKFANRPQTDIALKDVGGNYGLVSSNGHLWKEQRRFALSTLRDFGLGKPILENSILEEIELFLNAMQNESGAFNPLTLLNKAISNVITRLVYDRRFEYSDEYVFYILDTWNRRLKGVNATTGLGVKLWMINLIPGMKKRIETMFQESIVTRDLTNKMIKEHKEQFNPADEPTDYVHAFLRKQTELNGNNKTFTDQQLLIACNQIFAAGTETTATTLQWTLLMTTIHQDVQERVFQEIKQTIGLYSLPRLVDRNKLPYTEAVILETQRLATLVPLIGRQAVEDVQVNGYYIPAGTTVLVNHWAIHSSDDVFPEANKFKPERFLDERGKLKRDDAVMPFGSGKRICLGESLAKMELILFYVSMIQKFKFEIPKEDPPPSLEHVAGITVSPKPYRLVATPRITE